ncbi:ORF-90 [Teiidae poxvirus 1]|nr:ORF-90 [Teiidae poxvirus 1]
MAAANSNDEKCFQTLNDLRNHLKSDEEDNKSPSGTEDELVPEVVKKPIVKKNPRKSSKKVTSLQDKFVRELELNDLEINDDCEKLVLIDFSEANLVIKMIAKDLKDLGRRITAVKSVVTDLSLTDLPKVTCGVIKEVNKLLETLYNIGIEIPATKQQRKKAK